MAASLSPSAVLNKLLSLGASLLRVPARSSNTAKLEHALCILLGYLAVRHVAKVGPKEILNSSLANVLRVARKLPGASGAVAKQQAEILGKIKAMVLGEDQAAEPPNKELPEQGLG